MGKSEDRKVTKLLTEVEGLLENEDGDDPITPFETLKKGAQPLSERDEVNFQLLKEQKNLNQNQVKTLDEIQKLEKQINTIVD